MTGKRSLAILPAILPLLAGCDGVQSVFAPRSPDAEALLTLAGVVFVGGAVIFVLVLALFIWAILSGRRPPPVRGTTIIVAGGFVFPAVTLAALLTYSVVIGWRTTLPAGDGALRVHVVGHMWWWEVFYELPDGSRVETANELHLPVGREAEITVTTADVIHSFWVPGLEGKIDMIPGHVNRITFTPSAAGVMRGQCAEYCGTQHALMAFYVVAEPEDAFDRWLERQAAPAGPAPDGLLAQGRQAFVDQGCGGCHVVRGVAGADGALGPDLTHVGGRLSLAAGWLDRSVGTMAGWIASAQHIKPENRMPSFDRLDGTTLRAIAAWLESLE